MTARSRRLVSASLAVAALVACGTPARAFLKIGTRVGTDTVSLAWKTRPVRYFVSDRAVPEVSADQFRDAMARAAATWQAVPTSSITFEFAGLSSARPLDEDGVNTFGFLAKPELDRVLASTSFLVDTTTGEILESDIFFNSAFAWSVASEGEAGRYDLESIAAHEMGHVLGLGHSALGETELVGGGGRRLVAAGALMFPIAYSPGTTLGRTLQPDDVAGASDVYPDGNFRHATGSIQGRVRMNGGGVFGAHVVAFGLGSSALVGNFSLDDEGGFVIPGLSPGVYVVRVEPLDDGDAESFFDAADAVEDGFKAVFHPGLVVVPANGTAPSIDIEVTSK
jgi:hypothetical protein